MSKLDTVNVYEVLEKLKQPFPPEDHKKRKLPGQGEWIFVPWQKIRDRLDQILPLDWEVKYSDPVTVGDYLVIRCQLTILISQGGITREGLGNDKAFPELNEQGRPKIIGTPPERARADAFRGAAEEFGICGYLDDQAFTRQHVSNNNHKLSQFRSESARPTDLDPQYAAKIAQVREVTKHTSTAIAQIATRILGRNIYRSTDIKTEEECLRVCEALLNDSGRSASTVA